MNITSRYFAWVFAVMLVVLPKRSKAAKISLDYPFEEDNDGYNAGGSGGNPSSTNPLVVQCESSLPICIVGGGITGLVIAKKLSEAGRRVTVFEKTIDHIGGKLDTFRSWDAIWERGPVLFSDGEQTLHRYLMEYGLTAVPWIGQNVALFDPIKAEPRPISDRRLNSMRKNRDAVVAGFRKLYNSYPSWVFESRGFEHVHLLKSSHPDLFLTTEEWLHKYEPAFGPDAELEWAFGVIFTCEGYGHIRDLPSLYMLRLLNPTVLECLFDLLSEKSQEGVGIYTVKEGFRELPINISRNLPCVYQGYELDDLMRYPEEGRVFVKFNVGMKATTHKLNCSHVVLAFPPLLNRMAPIVDDLSPEDKRILGAVKVHKYFSSGHLLEPAGDKNVYLGTENGTWLQGDGQPIALVRSGKGDNNHGYTIYSWIYGRYDEGPGDKDFGVVDDLLRRFLRKFNKETPKIGFLDGYEFFPHVTARDVKDGWFADFARMQGRGGVYYASPVTSFESVNTAIENAEAVADLILHE